MSWALLFKLHAPRQALGVDEGDGEVERGALSQVGGPAAALLEGTREAVPSLTIEPLLILKQLSGANANEQVA